MDAAVRKIFTDACRAKGISEEDMNRVEGIASTVVLSTMNNLTEALLGFGADLPVAHREMCLGLVLDGLADGILTLTKAASEVANGA